MIKLQGKSQIMTSDSLIVSRIGEVQYIDGKPVQKAIQEFELFGNVQPLNGRDLLLVPEGDRFKEQYFIFTSFQLLVNDRVIRCGVNYQTQTVENWGSFIRARIMRIDVGQFATSP